MKAPIEKKYLRKRNMQRRQMTTISYWSLVFIALVTTGIAESTNFTLPDPVSGIIKYSQEHIVLPPLNQNTTKKVSTRAVDPFVSSIPPGASYDLSLSSYAYWDNVSPNGFSYFVMPPYVKGLALLDRYVPNNPGSEGYIIFRAFFTTGDDASLETMRQYMQEYCDAMSQLTNPESGQPFDIVVYSNAGIIGREHGFIGGQLADNYRLAEYMNSGSFSQTRPEPVGYFNYLQPKLSRYSEGGYINIYSRDGNIGVLYNKIKTLFLDTTINMFSL